MPRRLKLISGTSNDYTTIGIACQMKDYRFTFFLNEQLGFQLKRIEDFLVGEGKDLRRYSFFLFDNAEERNQYYLVSNFNEAGRLIPSEKGADFFLIVNDVLPESNKRELISRIKKISQVLAVYDIPKVKANNLEMIYEEIELHLI